MAIFTDERINSFLVIAGMFPLTTNRLDGTLADTPALGMVKDWNIRTNEAHRVIKVPMILDYN